MKRNLFAVYVVLDALDMQPDYSILPIFRQKEPDIFLIILEKVFR